MNVPILGKTIRLADLSGVAVAIGPVLTFHKRRVDLVADAGLQRARLPRGPTGRTQCENRFWSRAPAREFCEPWHITSHPRVRNNGLGGVPVSRWAAE